ncbi:MAG TPA: STAS domain-containing protein [Actinomycetota bacterium]|nr:STAS domain-containing protein [Actinomycetota bacterium]
MSFGGRAGLFFEKPSKRGSAVAVVISGRIERPDIPALCERVVAALQDGGTGVVVCDVEGIAPDAVALDALARLQLTARRRGGEIRLRGATRELRELLDLAGLCYVLPALGLEPGREPE